MLVNMFASKAFVYESLAIIYGRLFRKRVAVIIRGGWMPEFAARWPRWTRYVLSLPDLILTPNEFLCDSLSALGLRIDGKIPNFIEPDQYNFQLRSNLAPRFLYLRGMHPIYNPEMALRAFALIQRKHPDAVLTMVGREDRNSIYCRSLVHDLNLRNVNFLGLVPKDEIPKLADSHDIYLQTNRVDNMPVTVIEMWTCGLPVVATNVGGVPYLIRDGVNGMLVELEDYQGMAEICLDLLENPEKAQYLSLNGRTSAEKFTWERVVDEWQKALMLDATGL
jgi:glycosyltransferase involved in cell wall biosynthesis